MADGLAHYAEKVGDTQKYTSDKSSFGSIFLHLILWISLQEKVI